MSYDIKKNKIMIDKAESEGSIEIYLVNGEFKDKFVE